MGMWIALMFHSLMLLCPSRTISHVIENLSYLNITSGCICPSHNLTLECTVALTIPGQAGGKTVWRGTAFDCAYANNEITLLHNQFDSRSGACNNSIVARSLRVDNQRSGYYTYTSQLNVTINSDTLGQNITCQYDEDNISIPVITTVGSIKLIKKGQFNPSKVKYLVSITGSKRAILFEWSQFNTSTCPAISYNILASNCGSCPTTTDYTKVTCIDVPTDATNCIFALIPIICGGISPSLSVLLDVQLKDTNGHSGIVAACIFLTFIIIALLILISITLVFRFKGYIKRIFHFRFGIPIGRCSTGLCTDQTRETEAQLQCHYTSQYDEVGIYSCVDKDSDESSGSVLKIFDNKSEEKGIYGIDDDSPQHKAQYCNSDYKAHASSQATSMDPLSKLVDANPSALNLEKLLIKIGDVKSQWYQFGEAIGAPRDYLDTLSGEESQCLKNVVEHWLRHHPGQPMWEEVAEAQRKTKLQNQFKLKDKAADNAVDVPPPKPPRRRSSVNRSHSLSIASSHKDIK